MVTLCWTFDSPLTTSVYVQVRKAETVDVDVDLWQAQRTFSSTSYRSCGAM